MKKILYTLALSATFFGCKPTQNTIFEDQPIIATLDLVNVQDDKIMVTIDPATITSEEIVFYIPKTVPGTYSTSNFGQFVEELKAYDKKGKQLAITSLDKNTWRILDATRLDKVTYWINDSYDIEGEKGIFSMAGTNIKAGENYMLNLHGFIGYFENMTEEPYRLEILRPTGLFPGSALTVNESIAAAEGHQKDIFSVNRYFEVTDNPIMYATADTATFKVENMNVLLHIYSPNKVYSAQDFKPAMEKMVRAQKSFLGEIDQTNKYAILLYLSATPGEGDAGNFGALEHHTSTVVVMPESMGKEALMASLTDIVSHEFFHILTPLGIHSEEVHYFDYNDPEMSQHLWLYEGVTEYFANLFQVNKGLISNQEFYDRMNEKIISSMAFDDTMPFTVMSENILEEKYQDSYYNVYQKGALIGMALDIRLRELSNGEIGLLDLMKKLTSKYGKDRPFKDEELISKIVELTYPQIQEFFDAYVSGNIPIPYKDFFKTVGLELREGEIPVDYFLRDQATPYITINAEGDIVVRDDLTLSTFFSETGIEAGDIIKSINGKAYNVQNIYELISDSVNWKVGDNITLNVVRNGNEKLLKSRIIEPMSKGIRLVEFMNADGEQMELRHRWLKS